MKQGSAQHGAETSAGKIICGRMIFKFVLAMAGLEVDHVHTMGI